MERNHDEPEYITDADPADRPHKKSRLMGGLFLFLGALMTVVAFSGELDKEGGKIRAVVALLASGGSWVGIGLLLFPWTNRMVDGFVAENNFMVGVGKLPVLWKAWLALALLLSIAAVIGVIVTPK